MLLRRRLGTVVVSALLAGACGDTSATSTRAANRLADETSPYLLLHAHNPVDWYPWGPEALALARDRDRPIFLSVGYSTCYWCHVMEREVFSNPEIAAQMNRWFVNIKVDREERPDLDAIYMSATQIISGHGGWPNSVFLTPTLEPFFAGTYFPPEDHPGRPGFPRVMEAMNTVWTGSRDQVHRVAAEVTVAVVRAQAIQAPARAPDDSLVAAAVAQIKTRYDGTNGGFGGAPKFPPTMRLELLRQMAHDAEAGSIVSHTLEAMSRGGIYDHVGGGFHRYATDAQWRVPHFEKMLYNQAQMLRLYAGAYAATADERWRLVSEGILSYVRREMVSPEGGFYSALDAESEHVEGKYYTWTEPQVRATLGDGRADTLLSLYGLAHVPEGEGSALYQGRGLEEAADDLGLTVPALRTVLDAALTDLHEARRGRSYPLLDDKVITAWNGMMIAAIVEAGVSIGDSVAVADGARAARLVLERLRAADGGLYRVYRVGEARLSGYLEDYAHLADGLLALHRATGQTAWLQEATSIVEAMVERFWDHDGSGGFFFSAGGSDLIARNKVAHDGALPSANAVAVHVLLQMAAASGDTSHGDLARQAMAVFGGSMAAAPAAYAHMVAAVHRDRQPTAQRTAAPQSALFDALRAVSSKGATPDSVVAVEVGLQPRRLQAGGRAHFTVTLRIDEGWHVNAHPATAGMIPTSVTLNAGGLPVRVAGVDYPQALRLPFPALAETLSVYEGEVTVTTRLTVAQEARAAEGVLNAVIAFQPCDDRRCLQPVEVVRQIDVAIE